MNSFSFTLSGKHFICPSILNDSFARQSNLGCRSFLFITLNTSCQFLLAYKVSFEKSADSLLETPLQVTVFFSLTDFKTLSLSLTFGILIRMFFGVVLFESNLFGALCASWIYLSISFTKSGRFSFIIFKISFQFLLLLAPL